MPKVPSFKKDNDANRESASAGLAPQTTNSEVETVKENNEVLLPKNDEYEHRLSSDKVVISSDEPAETPVEEQLDQVRADAEANFKNQVAETQADNAAGEADTKEQQDADDKERVKRGDSKDSDLPFIAPSESDKKSEESN